MTHRCIQCGVRYRYRGKNVRENLCRTCFEWHPLPMPAFESDVQLCLAFLKANASEWLW